MAVSQKLTDEQVQELLFGDLQEAARKPHLGSSDSIDFTTRDLQTLNLKEQPVGWCELSELRFAMLICMNKPIGVNKWLNMEIIRKCMNKIFDDEHRQSQMFLPREDIPKFMEKLILRVKNKNRKYAVKGFEPRYKIRPDLKELDRKLRTWFGMEVCERNESFPEKYGEIMAWTNMPHVEVMPESEYVKKDKKRRKKPDVEQEAEGEEREEGDDQANITDEAAGGANNDDMLEDYMDDEPSTSGPSTSGPQPSYK